MKVLFVGDAVINSGFSVVLHNVCNELCTKFNLEVFGVGYDGRAKNTYPYHIYPAKSLGDLYSFSFLAEVVKKEAPDVVVIFNDDGIIAKYLYSLREISVSTIAMFPVNFLPLDKERLLSFFPYVNNMITYTEFSRGKILEVNPNIDVTAVYHGVHRAVFFPILNAKNRLGLDNSFVVGQVNTNTYRKRLDLFMIGFAKFAKGKPNARCLIHATNKDMAYDLPTLAVDLGIEDKVILSTNSVSFDKMNLLYNVMDVNCNTSIGEGFGLSLIEGAACGVPILCPNHGNLFDIWESGADFIDIERQEYLANTRFVGDIISVDDFVEKLNRFYDADYLKQKREEAFEYSKSDKFLWKSVADKIYNVILKANKNKLSYISS